eukprot:CAMPEP_0204530844 /NCGR_PEP_ID=MMETSP0661-20131031/10841_1 /ASSEMBLY_ACC=CAM_ASM_000606 /TAXON_ID=109239 /ORGANISM="Alexandrium margalefi, Strain AMGDE01CS-322" /LENGTH=365 /DNA_ID=CAMNT_0051536957 /DNA_START=46 /DNA_END=1143 /DNA_ORIENTATION=+
MAAPEATAASGCEFAVEEGLLAEPPAPVLGVEESDDGSSSAGADKVPARPGWGLRRQPRRLALAALGALALGCVAAGAPFRRPWQPAAQETDAIDDSVELGALGSMLEVMGGMAESVKQAAELTENVQKSYGNFQKLGHKFNVSKSKFKGIGGKLEKALTEGPEKMKKLREKWKSMNKTQRQKVKKRLFKRFNITSLKQLRPQNNMHDGNKCHDDEEEFGSLCYKKCNLLTGGHFPFRVSAFECCQHPGMCTEHYKINLKICGGFGVSGDQVGGGCPHTTGGCLKDEELYGNFCYKRCAIMTLQTLTSRVGPSTCCKEGTHGLLAFLEIGSCDTRQTYFVGGGMGDGDASTSNSPHMPDTAYTEA